MKKLIIFLLLTLTLNANELKNYEKNYPKYEQFIKKASKRHSIPSELISAIITVESNWHAASINKYNCVGLMQIKDGELNAWRNINSGTAIFKNYLIRMDYDTAKALTAYNRGFSGAKRWYKKHSEHPNYTKKVLRIYKLLKEKND